MLLFEPPQLTKLSSLKRVGISTFEAAAARLVEEASSKLIGEAAQVWLIVGNM